MAAASAAIAAVICDNSIEWLTDGEESDNSSVSVFDAEPNHTGFGTCIQCKSKNNNPMFRYCQKCFQVSFCYFRHIRFALFYWLLCNILK